MFGGGGAWGLIMKFYHVTWKCSSNIYFLGSTTVPSLANLKQRGRKKLIEHHLYKYMHFDHDFLPRDLKMKREYLLSMYSLATLKKRGQKILNEQLILSQQTNQTTARCKTTYRLSGIIQ